MNDIGYGWHIFLYVLLVFVMWAGVYETEENPFRYTLRIVTVAYVIANLILWLL